MNSWILPNVRSVATELAQLDVVSVALSLTEDQNHFVLRAVEAAHAAVILHPYAQVEELVVVLSTGRQELA